MIYGKPNYKTFQFLTKTTKIITEEVFIYLHINKY